MSISGALVFFSGVGFGYQPDGTSGGGAAATPWRRLLPATAEPNGFALRLRGLPGAGRLHVPQHRSDDSATATATAAATSAAGDDVSDRRRRRTPSTGASANR